MSGVTYKFKLREKDVEAVIEAMHYCAGASVEMLQERYKRLARFFEAEFEKKQSKDTP